MTYSRVYARNKVHLKSRFRRYITKAAWLKLETYFTFPEAKVLWLVPRVQFLNFLVFDCF